MEENETALNYDIALAYKWLTQNKLSLNVNKAKSMLSGTNKSLTNSTNTKLGMDINREAAEQVNLFKYLGLWFNPLLNWSSHLQTTY